MLDDRGEELSVLAQGQVRGLLAHRDLPGDAHRSRIEDVELALPGIARVRLGEIGAQLEHVIPGGARVDRGEHLERLEVDDRDVSRVPARHVGAASQIARAGARDREPRARATERRLPGSGRCRVTADDDRCRGAGDEEGEWGRQMLHVRARFPRFARCLGTHCKMSSTRRPTRRSCRRCWSMISGASLSRTPRYQTPSG